MAIHERVDGRFYQFAERLREDCFAGDGSLFHPGEAVWTLENLQRLHAAYVGGADEGEDDCWTKLANQLEGEPAGVVDLMAEMQFVQTLGANEKVIKPETILEQVERILAARRPAVEVPQEIAASVTIACRNPGQSLHQHRYWQLRFLLEAAIAFKQLDSERRAELLGGPDAWRTFLDAIDVQAAQSMRNHLLHLMFPGAFELIASDGHKQAIEAALAEPEERVPGNVDATLRKIRARLEHEHGRGFEFCDPQIAPLWQKEATGLESARIWKIAPGEGARVWPQWKAGGFASMGWTELGDLTGLTEEQWDLCDVAPPHPGHRGRPAPLPLPNLPRSRGNWRDMVPPLYSADEAEQATSERRLTRPHLPDRHRPRLAARSSRRRWTALAPSWPALLTAARSGVGRIFHNRRSTILALAQSGENATWRRGLGSPPGIGGDIPTEAGRG
ncbi:hypothetical protein HNQ78_002904 [Phycisphaera mikurensis]|nr:hypothetical protein [Phycisphaera mikurensis]